MTKKKTKPLWFSRDKGRMFCVEVFDKEPRLSEYEIWVGNPIAVFCIPGVRKHLGLKIKEGEAYKVELAAKILEKVEE